MPGCLGMVDDEPDAQFTVAVEDFGGAWATVAQARARMLIPYNSSLSTSPCCKKSIGLDR